MYAQILGPAFGQLAPALKRLHGSEQRCFTGVLTVRTETHPLARLSLWLAGLPRSHISAPCLLCLLPSKRGERWQRYIGPWKFITHQRLAFSEDNRRIGTAGSGEPAHEDSLSSGGEIRERFGAITLSFCLRVKGRSLCIRSIRSSILGINLPGWFGISVVAIEKSIDDHSFYCNVRVHLAGLGALLRYHGKLSQKDS